MEYNNQTSQVSTNTASNRVYTNTRQEPSKLYEVHPDHETLLTTDPVYNTCDEASSIRCIQNHDIYDNDADLTKTFNNSLKSAFYRQQENDINLAN